MTKAHHVEDDYGGTAEVFFIHTVKSTASQPALVMCTVSEHHKVTFEIDTGASCNILPLTDYIKATGDRQGSFISSTQTQLTMQSHTSWKSYAPCGVRCSRGVATKDK